MAAHMLRALFLCFKFFPLVMDEEQEVGGGGKGAEVNEIT